MPIKSVANLMVTKVSDGSAVQTPDALAIEEPLEMRLEYGLLYNRKVHNVSVTMRTPGNDAELAMGFLFTEGIISSMEDMTNVEHCFIACAENKENVIQVSLNNMVTPNLQNTERNFYTTSSCGVCGKGSISAIRTISLVNLQDDTNIVNADILVQLPDTLSSQQKVFADTGGLHASALFTPGGEMLLVREDVGRHNALDKLIGASLKNGWLPLNDKILLLSGRASFELVQKAVMAGINIIAAVGAPSSLAVQLAEEFNITLIGFLRNKRFNIYTAAQRVNINNYETAY